MEKVSMESDAVRAMPRSRAGSVRAARLGAVKLDAPFFSGSADEVAARLLGTIMVRAGGKEAKRARIVETEAYLGPKDLASHSSKGRTARTDVMFGPPARAYVYFVYGMHHMFNVVVGREGEAHAVLIRAAEPLDGWEADLSGPGKLARGFGVGRSDNRLDLTGDDIFFVSDPDYHPKIGRTKRIGVDYARHWKNRLLRYIDLNSPLAAKLRRMNGRAGR
jgi:DNA-3-methyladenine glycosylase